MKRILLLLCFIVAHCSLASAGAYIYDFNSNCLKAYKQIMALQQEEANETLKAEIQKNPNNLIPHYLADYSDCLRILFNGNEDELPTFKINLDTRLDLLEQGDKSSAWHLFCKANIQFHWALVHLRSGENFKAANRFRKSFLYLKENKILHPQFQENNVLWGLEEAVAGAIPENYKWIGAVFGIRGNINKGVSEIAHYLNTHMDGTGAMQEEAMIYYGYLKFYLQSAPETAWRYLNGAQFAEQNNLMRSFIKANIALNYRKADIAYSILNKAKSVPYYEQYPILQYELAESMLLRLDMNCLSVYQQFLKSYKGDHFVKDSWLKMAWVAYLQDNKTARNEYLTQIVSKGNALTDADKQAQRFAEKPTWSLRSLLEVRLLIDGGFYTKALEKIQIIDKKELGNTVNVLDYNFRYGRIFEELKNDEKALLFYTATVQIGRDKKEYFAARAALQMAFIYERKGMKNEAIQQFNDCLSMRNHDAQSSIDQLAKAGLNRLEK